MLGSDIMNTLIWYSKCSTCKNAKKYLDENNIKVNLRDIKENNPTKEELDELIKKSNLDIKSFFNTSGLVYKSLNLKDKLQSMSFEEKIQILASDGMLVKIPILLYNNKVLVGFKKNEWDELIK